MLILKILCNRESNEDECSRLLRSSSPSAQTHLSTGIFTINGYENIVKNRVRRLLLLV